MPVISRIAVAAARGYGMFRSAAAAVADAYFKYVTLLLPGNGTNGAQNNTFLDSSTNNFTITRNGNTTQGTFSPYGANWSNYFDGAGDYLSINSATALNLGTGDFTIECWVFPITGINDVDGVISKRSLSTFNGGEWRVAYRSASNAFGIACGSNNVDRLTPAISLNAWSHIAFVRSSGTLSCYANGVRGDNLTWTDTLDNPEVLRIGLNVTSYDFPGYISNVRIVKGTAVYSGATYTVPTAPLSAITNTSLLTCQSNRFIDNSTNNFAITVVGDTNVQRFSPFSPTAAYSASTIGGSGYFDGSGDYLSVADNSALEGFGDFTIEFWLNLNSIATGTCVLTKGWSSGNYAPYLFYVNGTNLALYASSNGSTWDVSNNTTITALTTGQWYHIAVSRSGSSLRIFANGSLVTTVTNGTALMTNASALTIAADSAGASAITGYVSNVRITNTAVYTAAFTPATSPLSAVSGTALLLNFTNIGVIDNAMMNDLETVGNAQISTTQSKWGGGSLAFDGAGDYLYLPSRATTSFVGDFTVEFWAYRNSGPFRGFTIGDDSGSTGLSVYYSSGSAVWIVYNTNATRISGGSSTASAWQHIAVVRSSGVVKLYVDGTNVGSSWASTGTFSGNIYVGAEFNSGTAYADTNGYIDDLRMTNGYARYTSNFTAPTAPFPLQ